MDVIVIPWWAYVGIAVILCAVIVFKLFGSVPRL